MPARNPYTDEAIEARYHTSVIALVALERACVDRSLGNEDIELCGRCPVTRAFSGRDSDELTLDRLARDELATDDVRIHPDTLRAAGRRWPSSTATRSWPRTSAGPRSWPLVPEAEVLALYEALRPHRATADELEALAAELDGVPAPLCAALVREAADGLRPPRPADV